MNASMCVCVCNAMRFIVDATDVEQLYIEINFIDSVPYR